MNHSISDTAEYGEYSRGPRLVNAAVKEQMRKNLEEVRNGTFAREYLAEKKAGAPKMDAARKAMAEHPIEVVGEKLRDMMPWIKANKMVDKSRN